MSLTKLTENLNNVSSLPDKPSLQAEELKALFDMAGNTIKLYLNEVLTQEIDTIITEITNSITGNKTELTTKITDIENSIKNKQNTIKKGTSAPTGGNDGDIYIQYF